MPKFVELSVGDRIMLKKGHPCGANDWTVIKLGMDIGLKCNSCGRKVKVLRADLDKAFKKYLTDPENIN